MLVVIFLFIIYLLMDPVYPILTCTIGIKIETQTNLYFLSPLVNKLRVFDWGSILIVLFVYTLPIEPN